MKLIKKDRLPASYCGADVKLSVMGAFRIVEDMVTELMGDLEIDGVTCMKKYGAMWVFVRNRIEIPQRIGWMEEYTVTSYISSFSRAKLYIDTVMTRQDGSVVLVSRLELCAVDLETGKIRKAETVGVGENTPPEEEARKIAYSRIKPLRTAGSEEGLLDEVTVRATDIDYCYHTNNISYVRYIMNQYDTADLTVSPVSAIEIQYAAQTHEGDLLKIYSCGMPDDHAKDTDAFAVELDGRTVVTCQITRQDTSALHA